MGKEVVLNISDPEYLKKCKRMVYSVRILGLDGELETKLMVRPDSFMQKFLDFLGRHRNVATKAVYKTLFWSVRGFDILTNNIVYLVEE